MSRYPSEGVARFDQQFRETEGGRNERLRETRFKRNIESFQRLIADLASEALADEGPDWSQEGLDKLRVRVANAIPPDMLPECFAQWRDPPVVRS